VKPRTRTLPHWRDVAAVIPEDFRFDGASSPFSPLYGLIYGRRTRADIMIASRVHDYLYGPARLSGSPYVAAGCCMRALFTLGREEADAVYRHALFSLGHPIVGKIHYTALRRLGGFAWRANARRMRARGIYSYAQWMRNRRH